MEGTEKPLERMGFRREKTAEVCLVSSIVNFGQQVQTIAANLPYVPEVVKKATLP